MCRYLSDQEQHADLLEDYQEAISRGELPWLEEDFAKDGCDAASMKYVLAALRKGTKPSALSPPHAPPPPLVRLTILLTFIVTDAVTLEVPTGP